MKNGRTIAQDLRKDKNYNEALSIYIKLWNLSDMNNVDKWLGWEYAHTCKKIDRIDDAIEISKIVYKKYPKFKNNTDLLCWCLFEKYIKNLDETMTVDNFKRVLSIATFIIKNTENSEKTAFSYTINCMLKLLKKKSEFITEDVLLWLDIIDPNGLSDIPVIYNLNKKEGMSPKENYYSFKTKTLFKLKRYEKCISVCEEALRTIYKFHHDNNIWIQVRKAKCFIALNRSEEALKLLQELALYKEHWSLYYEISKVYLALDDMNNSIIYLCRALVTKDKPEMKVNLYEYMGKLLEILNEYEIALKHYLFCKNIRNEKNWNLSSTLENKIASLQNKLTYNVTFNEYELRNFWNNKLIELLGEKVGRISNITAKGNAGFIKTNDSSYYFKISSTIGKKDSFNTGTNVRFCVIDSYNIAKQQYSKEAICIFLMKKIS